MSTKHKDVSAKYCPTCQRFVQPLADDRCWRCGRSLSDFDPVRMEYGSVDEDEYDDLCQENDG